MPYLDYIQLLNALMISRWVNPFHPNCERVEVTGVVRSMREWHGTAPSLVSVQ